MKNEKSKIEAKEARSNNKTKKGWSGLRDLGSVLVTLLCEEERNTAATV